MRSWPELLAGWRAVREGYERREFEAWGTEMMRCGGAGDNETAARFMRHRTGPLLGEYVDAKVEARWQAWKARASLHANISAALAAVVGAGAALDDALNEFGAEPQYVAEAHQHHHDALEALRALLEEELPDDA